MIGLILGVWIVAMFGGFSKWAIIIGFIVAMRDWPKFYRKLMRSLK